MRDRDEGQVHGAWYCRDGRHLYGGVEHEEILNAPDDAKRLEMCSATDALFDLRHNGHTLSVSSFL
jgi:hypothetical protein